MSQCIELFPLKVYKDVYSKTDDLKHNLFAKLKEVFDKSEQNNNLFMQDGTLCSYDSNSQLHTQFPDETKDIVEFVENAAKAYWKQCNYHEGLTPFVFQMWANTTPRGGYIDPHLHGNMPFTAVVYVDASPEQGNIILDNPLDMVLMSQPISPSVKYPLGQEISVSTGDLLMFPGYLKHRVKPNTTDKDRLILGFNIGCRGNYWSEHLTVGKTNV
jgi:uncharacterized protein (TIGR02466 family)